MLHADLTPCSGTAHAGRLHWRAVDEGWVCFDVESNSTFLLPPLARWICEQGSEARRDEQVLWQRLQAETGDEAEDCRAAVLECMAPLRDAGLIPPADTLATC